MRKSVWALVAMVVLTGLGVRGQEVPRDDVPRGEAPRVEARSPDEAGNAVAGEQAGSRRGGNGELPGNREQVQGRRGGPAAGGAGRGGEAPSKPAEPRNDVSATTGTLHSAPLNGETGGGREMTYTATAGYMPLKDDHDRLRANIFYTAYTAGAGGPATARNTEETAAAGAGIVVTTRPASSAGLGVDVRRPVTFLFNGGPGSSSAWLHIGAVGPRRIDIPEDGSPPKVPYRLVENQYSWLPATDLVFVDPVNTGYSRAATPEMAKEFFGVREDVDAMGEFIRLYLTKNSRWNSPIYIAGESYGTTRCAALSQYLQERIGANLSGVILISTVLNFSMLMPSDENDLPYALHVPSYAAVAWYHKKAGTGRKLEDFLKDAETFAMNDYLGALAKGAGLSADERARVAARTAELTGLRKEYVLESGLRIPPERFEKELLRSPTGEGSMVIGRFDGRLTGWPTDTAGDAQEYDPSFEGFLQPYTAMFNDYVRRQLKYENDLTYEVLSNKVQPWNYGSGGPPAGNGYLYVGDNLRNAMTHNPALRLLVCSGRFDLATPYFATDYQIAHLHLAAGLQKNIRTEYYPAGHMLYHVRPALEKLYKDATAFIANK
jgi:carboxypeptidase C (cathepsin A)